MKFLLTIFTKLFPSLPYTHTHFDRKARSFLAFDPRAICALAENCVVYSASLGAGFKNLKQKKI